MDFIFCFISFDKTLHQNNHYLDTRKAVMVIMIENAELDKVDITMRSVWGSKRPSWSLLWDLFKFTIDVNFLLVCLACMCEHFDFCVFNYVYTFIQSKGKHILLRFSFQFVMRD